MSLPSIENLLKKLKSDDDESGFSFDSATKFVNMVLDLTQLVADTSNSAKLSKAVTYGSMAVTLSAAGMSLYGFYQRTKEAKTYTIKIMDTDPIYEIVEEWFMSALPEEKQLSVYANSVVKNRRLSQTNHTSVRGLSESFSDPVEIISTFDGTMMQTLDVAGHSVKAHTYIPESSASAGAGNYRGGRSKQMGKSTGFISITCRSVEARQAVLKELESQAQYLSKGNPSIYTSTSWGDFRKKATLQARSTDSVILKKGQMDRIIDYLEKFFEYEEHYAKIDIPFRTGIMLYGTPGSGKSSTAVAIANHMKMNVYIITLSAISSDETLSELFSSIPENSIIVLEDIDIVSAVKERDDSDKAGVTMSGMLNVLDGMSSAHRCVTIMTTNRLEVLDDAVIRPGRVDLLEHLDFMDTYQLEKICEYTMGSVPEGLPEITSGDEISPAEIMGVIRMHVPNFIEAAPDVIKLIEGKIAASVAV